MTLQMLVGPLVRFSCNGWRYSMAKWPGPDSTLVPQTMSGH